MAKRLQPQPKQQPPSKQLTRKQISHREQEQRFARRVLIGAAGVLGLVVLILAWGLIDQFAIKPRQPVATVAGVPIRLSDYQSLLRYRRLDYHNYISNLQSQRLQYASAGDDSTYIVEIIDQQITYAESELSSLPGTVLEEMIDDEITRQECATRGITVSPNEIDLRLEQQFGYERATATPVTATTSLTLTPQVVTPVATATLTATTPVTITPTPTVTPTAPMTYDEYVTTADDWFSQMRKETRFGEAEFRKLLESVIYREKLEQAIGAEVPLTADQVHAQQILVMTQEEADAVVARLKAGEEWAALAAELSQDSATKDASGDLGWFPKGSKGDTFDEAVFAAEADPTNTLIVEDDSGWHVVRVLERDPARYLSESDLDSARQTAVSDWFAAHRVADGVVRLLDYTTMVPADPYATSTS